MTSVTVENPIKAFSFLIVGLARNCERTIQNDVLRLNNSLKSAAAVYWLIIESDSDDLTIDALEELSQNVINFDYITLGALERSLPKRTERIAFCRNRYATEVKKNLLYRDIDYVIVCDLDDINTKITDTNKNNII
jgi:hypothetical protein